MLGITMDEINNMSKEELINLAYTQIKYVITDINEDQVRKDNFDNWCHYSKAVLTNPNLLKEHAKLGFKGYDECSVLDIIIKLKFNNYDINYIKEKNDKFIYIDELENMEEDDILALRDDIAIVGLDEDDFKDENHDTWKNTIESRLNNVFFESPYIEDSFDELYNKMSPIELYKTLVASQSDILYRREGINNNVL